LFGCKKEIIKTSRNLIRRQDQTAQSLYSNYTARSLDWIRS